MTPDVSGSNLNLELDDDLDVDGLITALAEVIAEPAIKGATIHIEGDVNWRPI